MNRVSYQSFSYVPIRSYRVPIRSACVSENTASGWCCNAWSLLRSIKVPIRSAREFGQGKQKDLTFLYVPSRSCGQNINLTNCLRNSAMIIIMASIVWPKQHIAVTQPLAVSLPAPQTQLVVGGRPQTQLVVGNSTSEPISITFPYVPVYVPIRSKTHLRKWKQGAPGRTSTNSSHRFTAAETERLSWWLPRRRPKA